MAADGMLPDPKSTSYGIHADDSWKYVILWTTAVEDDLRNKPGGAIAYQ